MKPPDSLHALQLGPLWVLSAVAGTSTYFTPVERDSFWRVVDGVASRTPTEARVVLQSVIDAGPDLFLDFELDDRPAVSGLRGVITALGRVEPEVAADFKNALFQIGVGVAKARGPYGQQVTAESQQLLLLLAELLELRSPSPETWV